LTFENERQKPEKKFKAGSITATLWRSGDNGKRYVVVFDKTYKDKEGNWATTNRFNAQEAATVALLAKQAFEYMTQSE
jgi:hypothetical protein